MKRKCCQALQRSELQLHYINNADLIAKNKMKKKLVNDIVDWIKLSNKNQKKHLKNI